MPLAIKRATSSLHFNSHATIWDPIANCTVCIFILTFYQLELYIQFFLQYTGKIKYWFSHTTSNNPGGGRRGAGGILHSFEIIAFYIPQYILFRFILLPFFAVWNTVNIEQHNLCITLLTAYEKTARNNLLIKLHDFQSLYFVVLSFTAKKCCS